MRENFSNSQASLLKLFIFTIVSGVILGKYSFEHSIMINEEFTLSQCDIESGEGGYRSNIWILPRMKINATLSAEPSKKDTNTTEIELNVDLSSDITMIPISYFGLSSCKKEAQCSIDLSTENSKEISFLGTDRLFVHPGTVAIPILNNLNDIEIDAIPKMDVWFSTNTLVTYCKPHQKSPYGTIGLSPKSSFLKFMRENYVFKNGVFEFGISSKINDRPSSYNSVKYNFGGISDELVKGTNSFKNNKLSWISLAPNSDFWTFKGKIQLASSRTTELVQEKGIDVTICIMPASITTVYSLDLQNLLGKRMLNALCNADSCNVKLGDKNIIQNSLISLFGIRVKADNGDDIVFAPRANKLEHTSDFNTNTNIYYFENTPNDKLLEKVCGTSKMVVVVDSASVGKIAPTQGIYSYESSYGYIGFRMSQDGKFQIGIPYHKVLGEFKIDQSFAENISTKIVMFGSYAGIGVAAIVAFMLYRKCWFTKSSNIMQHDASLL